MRLFNDMVTAILACDKPVICRVNGMRIGGGQEIGMACDFSVAQDLARFGQAGPKHGSAPIGGATDFLPRDRRHRARDGGLRAVRAVLGAQGLPDGRAHRHRAGAEGRRQVRRQPAGRDRSAATTSTAASSTASRRPATRAKEGKALLARGTVDLCLLDAKVDELCAKLLLTFPDCMTKTLEELRKPKLDAWNRNKENSRAWLALNMMTEARAGFTAFNDGPKDDREVDFVLLRQKLAAGAELGRPAARRRSSRRRRERDEPQTRAAAESGVERDGAAAAPARWRGRRPTSSTPR